jgi:hypothetical protein
MSGRSAKSNNRGSDLFGYFVSGKYKEFHTNQYAGSTKVTQGLTATGGIISDYTSGSDVFRAHIFTSSGELDVTALSASLPNNVDFLVVGGGGAGGSDPGNNGAAGGGGAGGYRSSMPEGPGGPSPSTESQLTLSVQTYTVTVGGGGAATNRPGIVWFLTDKDIGRTNTKSGNITHVGISNTCIVASHVAVI